MKIFYFVGFSVALVKDTQTRYRVLGYIIRKKNESQRPTLAKYNSKYSANMQDTGSCLLQAVY